MNIDAYNALLLAASPKVIVDDVELERILAIIEPLHFKKVAGRTPEETALYNLLLLLTNAYEEKMGIR